MEEIIVLHTISPRPRHYLALKNWSELNNFLHSAGLEDCRLLIKMETTNPDLLARKTFVNRIWGRYRVAKKIAEIRGKR